MYYTLKEWLEAHEDTSIYDNVYLFDIRHETINFDNYAVETQEEIMNAEVIDQEVYKDGYFISYDLSLDILKGEIEK